MLGTDSLRIRRGVSQSSDPASAVAELYGAIHQDDAALILFYASSKYDLDELGRHIRKRFGDATVIGCTTAGEITPSGYLVGALTGVSIGSDDFRVVSRRFDGLRDFDFSHGQEFAQELLGSLRADSLTGVTPSNTFGLLLIDGLSRREEAVVSAFHSGLEGIQLFGGSSGDDGAFERTYLYHDGAFRSDCAVFTLIQTSRKFEIFKTQHFVPTETKMVVTKADPVERRVIEINGDLARDEYARLVGLSAHELTSEALAMHPVLVKAGGDYFVRSIMQANDDGSITFACAIDEGIVLTLSKAVDLLQNLEQLFRRLRQSIGETQLILGCDCFFRSIEIHKTGLLDPVSRLFRENNVIGFTTYGEQFNAMHINQTFTGIALGESTET